MANSYDPEVIIKYPDEIETENYVVDFFNSHFRELEDLEKLNLVLAELKENEHSLDEKRIQTQEKTSIVLQQSLVSFTSTITELESLQSTRLELEDALTDHCNAMVSQKILNTQGVEDLRNETIMEQLVTLQQQLDSLERSKQYLKVLVVIDELSTKAKQLVEKSPQKALVPYTQLAHLARKIKTSSKEAGHAVSHLDIYLQRCVDALWEDMKSRLTKKFQHTLNALNWPTPIKVPYTSNTTDKLSTFRKAFTELLLLQQPVEDDEVPEPLESKNPKDDNESLPPLLPIQIMVEPLMVRFRYHFDSKRPTNRIDKPEWYFSHVITTIREHLPFLSGAVQSIVDDAGFEKYHAKNEFIRCLLVAVTRKLNNSVPKLLNSPQVFSHTVFETLQFDQTLRELHMYTPSGQKEWKGCVEVFVGKKEWFKAWLKVEKDFAEERYNEIMHSEDAWEIVDEENPDDEYKPTKSAAKLINLLELVTNRYKLLPMFYNRIRFLVDIQAEILLIYAKRIISAVDAFENLSYSFVRAVPNTDGKSITGIEGLKRLCRWLNSAGFVSRTIKEWVTVRAARNTGVSPLPSPTSTSSINSTEQGQRASSAHVDEEITVDEGTVFDDPAELFDNVCERIQSLIVKNVSREFLNGLKTYSKKNNWSRSEIYGYDSTELTTEQIHKLNNQSKDIISRSIIELSPELYMPLSDLAHSLTFLSNNLPDRIFKHIYKDVSKELEDHLWDRILMRNQFSEMGGWQFEIDMEKGLFTIGKRWIRKPESYFRRLRDACILLTLPANQSPLESECNNKKPKQKTLSQVISVLFDDELEQTTVSRMLENLGVYHLTSKEAKNVIGRRVDCWK
ncbi:4940_t:CDS:10 [Funneliformis geosporum]|uniref:9625_t:CDS:1 n=1 Tax=Funneliformis geosporum TaxID=1117311 RepID=A0A9W4SLH7_9GLOM|nr:9625_t:CDS:10 [Funneliformis geosporum]CAI2175239.1 4940_t:CDS:10 [Funneliformis geosporum]